MMEQTRLRILIVEDSPDDALFAARELSQGGLDFDLERVETREDFIAAVVRDCPDIIISDYTLPNFDGMSALAIARERCPNVPFIFVSGTLGEDRAVESLKLGAADYVVKGNLKRLAPAAKRAIEEARLRADHRRAEQALRASEVRFRLLAEQAPVGILLADAAGRASYVNKYWRETTGIVDTEIEGDLWGQTIHPDDRAWVLQLGRQTMSAKRDFLAEYRYLHPGGEIKWAVARAVPQRDDAGMVTGYVGILHDITERKLAEERIARLSRVHEVLSGINVAIVRNRTREDLLREVCQIAVDRGRFRVAVVFECDRDDKEPRLVAQRGVASEMSEALVASRSSSEADGRGMVGEAIRTGQPAFSNDVVVDVRFDPWRKLLERHAIRSAMALPLSIDEAVVGVILLMASEWNFFTAEEYALLRELAADVAFALDHIEKQQRLDYLAYYDTLTGLANRRLFTDRLSTHLRDAERSREQIAVVTFDIERLRQINESFGRQAGDQLLRDYAARLRDLVPENEHLGHLGNDLFSCLIPNIADGPSVASILERDLARLGSAAFPVDGTRLRISTRVGVALFPNDGTDAETLLRNGEAALRQAKASTEQIVFYAPAINARVSQRLTLENKLRLAIDAQEFVLHYQPKIDLKTGMVNSLEALIRWQEPGNGLIPPGEFIPILEDTGMIYEVGLWALRQASRDYAQLQQHFADAPRIAVNVSSVQLHKANFLEDVTGILSARGPDHGVDLEITESVIMRRVEENIRKLHEIRKHQVHIAIDDFGTGYSSLSYIAKLPVDLLKIDRAFIVNVTSNADDLAIVSSVISLAHALNLKVVAEGVETQEQAQLLRALDCDKGQGYLFCNPLPLDDLIARLSPGGSLIS